MQFVTFKRAIFLLAFAQMHPELYDLRVINADKHDNHIRVGAVAVPACLHAYGAISVSSFFTEIAPQFGDFKHGGWLLFVGRGH